MKFHKLFVIECVGFLLTAQKILGSDLVLLEKSFKPWMTDIPNAVQIDERPRQIELAILRDLNRGTPENTITMLNRRESVVHIPHIPMDPVAMLPRAYEFEEKIKHLSFQFIIMPGNLVERDMSFLCYLMD